MDGSDGFMISAAADKDRVTSLSNIGGVLNRRKWGGQSAGVAIGAGGGDEKIG
jgi:hypothetical protein